MQISKVSLVNFQAKKITPKEVKKAVNPMEEFIHNEKGMYEFYPPRTSISSPKTENADIYIKQYAENREAMKSMPSPEKKDIKDYGKDYFTPFAPTGEKK